MHLSSPARNTRPQGFTLLETAITLFIVALLVTAVFGVLQSSLQLADTIRGEQERELRIQKFVEMCETVFNRLPPDAVISIRPSKGFGNQAQIVEIANGLSPFDAATPGTLQLSAIANKDGSTSAGLRYEENPVNFVSTQRQNTTRPVEMSLLNAVSTFQWRIFDPQTQQWIMKWNENVTAADLLKNGGGMVPAVGLPPTGQNLTAPGAVGIQPAPTLDANGQPIPGALGTGGAVPPAGSTSAYPRPPMLELQLGLNGEEPRRWIFWVPASFSQ